jgi:molybdopterin-biosynthesis enzyme MoeA-like protein
MSAKVIRWKLISGLLLVFVLGILVGSLTTGFYLKHRLAPFVKDPKARKAFIMKKLAKELQLTSTQESKIEPIVEQMIEKRREYYLKSRPQIKKIMDQGFDQIEEQLTENQKEKLDKLRDHFKKYKGHRDAKRSRE